MEIEKYQKLKKWILVLSIWILIFEVISFILINFGFLNKYIFKPPKKLSFNLYQNIISERNNITGWPSKTELARRYDSNGARKSPENKIYSITKKPCLAIYGDSYAFDDEVTDSEAWPNKLSRILRCPVLNFGVGSFGVDQAFLRFVEKNPNNVSAIFTFIDGDFARSLTRNYSLYSISRYDPKQSKPFFTLSKNDSQKLIFNSIEKLNYKQYNKLIENPENFKKYLKDDYFLPGKSLYSNFETNFPYSISIMRMTSNLANRLISTSAYISWNSYYDLSRKLNIQNNLRLIAEYPPSYSDYSLILNKKIFYKYIDYCNSRDIKCLIVKLPYIKDFDHIWVTPIEKELSKDNKLKNYFSTIPRNCLIKEYKKRGITIDNIKNQLAKNMHYNPTSSSVIASCIGKLVIEKNAL